MPQILYLNLFPNSDLIAYTTATENDTIVIYHLSQCRQLYEKTFDETIYYIQTKENGLLLDFATSDDQLFSWDGERLHPLKSFNSTVYAKMSSNGLVLYKKSTDQTILSFYNATSGESRSVDAGVDFSDVMLTADGRYFSFATDDSLSAEQTTYINGGRVIHYIFKVDRASCLKLNSGQVFRGERLISPKSLLCGLAFIFHLTSTAHGTPFAARPGSRVAGTSRE